MATIDNLDLSVYNLYALRTKMMEQINQELRLDQASSIPPQTHVVDNYPKLSELDLLLGIAPHAMPWAYFFAPTRFKKTRRSPFSFSRVVPSFGDEEELEQRIDAIRAIPVTDPDEEEEKYMITSCLGKITEINDWLGHIVGRMGQFLQG